MASRNLLKGFKRPNQIKFEHSQLTDTLAQMRADGTLERIVGRYLENASQYLEVDTIGA